MSKFLTSNALNTAIENLFENADQKLILISPYIKLHERFISSLKTKLDKDKLEIIIVFGKNEDDISRSMNLEDFNFFKQFPNVQIRYEKRLHAKYYASEDAAILTSMNLYNYSHDNNIESGVLTKPNILSSLLSNVTESLDDQAWTYFERVIEQSVLLFHNVPEYVPGMLGIGKKYKSSSVVVDKLSDFFNEKEQKRNYSNGNGHQRFEKTSNGNYGGEKPQSSMARRAQNQKENHQGFCIRSGEPIEFNPDQPMSRQSYRTWSQFGNEDYPENFCHFSGEPSNGETCYAKPILKKNWRKAKEIIG